MTLFDILLQITFYGCITAVVTSWLLFRRMQTPTRSRIRVHMSGGTERSFEASEVGDEIVWIQEGEEMKASVPHDLVPGHSSSWGVHYRMFDIIHGSDKVLRVPWLNDEIRGKVLETEEAGMERYRRRVRALDAFKQLTSGLSNINRWQAVALIALGIFAGLYLSPIIAGALS